MSKNKVVYIEGLPGSGKSTLIERLSLRFPDLHTIGEYIDTTNSVDALNDGDETFFVRNDENKYKTARLKAGLCIVDRGHLSTILYNKAYEKIKGQLPVDVDRWYSDKILAGNMLPDAYIHLDTVPATSLARRAKSDWDNMWDYEEALEFASIGYREYMAKYEAHIPVLHLSADSLSIEQVDAEVIKFLGLEDVK